MMTTKKNNGHKPWKAEDEAYLIEKWGVFTVDKIANVLGRTRCAILKKAWKLNLGPTRQAGGHITLNELIRCLKVNSGWYHGTSRLFIKNGLPYQTKIFLTRPVKIVNINKFWKWAEKHKELIDWSKLETNLLGKEPAWVQERRSIDFYNYSRRRQRQWSKLDDIMLKRYIEEDKTLEEITRKLNRTATAVRRRCYDLYLAYPRTAYKVTKWTKEEEELVCKMKEEGYNLKHIAEKLDRSENSVANKIMALKKQARSEAQ